MTEIVWPDTLTISWAKQLARQINKEMGIGHSRALHVVASHYGYTTWIACRAALQTDAERAEKLQRDMWRQQRQARKWAEGNARRAAESDALAAAEPGWIGKDSAAARLDPGMRPADSTAADVVFRATRGDA